MHTKGQWELKKRDDEPGATLVLGGEGEIVAECSSYYTGRSQDEAEANARLIAMAPAMLKFIQQTRNWVSDMGHDQMTNACDDLLREVS